VFDYREGAPDIALPPDNWVEAKAISPGLSAATEFRRARGQPVVGTVAYTGQPSRLLAVADALRDAKKKFARQRAAGGIVFFNLASLSFGEMVIEDQIHADYTTWADIVEGNDPGAQIVLVVDYDWRRPFREPELAAI
jgi:hypothetical protein